MERLFADLHLHTAYSDGTFSPVELVRYAQKAGLSAISITDHDITDGITEGLKEGAKRGVEVIPGIELSAELKTSGEHEMHILGYYLNWESVKFQEELKLFRQARERRAFHILDKLAQIGIKLNEERLFKIAGIGSIGRLHFAKAMLEEKIVSHTQEAFEKYLGEGRPAYVPKLRLQPEDAIRMIHRVGGLPVLAHPFYGGINKATVKSLVNKGLMGIEVWHIKHPPEAAANFKKWAEDLGIFMTGGTDCHGKLMEETVPLLGRLKIDYKYVVDMKLAKARLDKNRARIME
ncbi:MAG: hypothetical protein CVU77_01170 [Elusimicrobia bacterium HGW-Elusimicrobia-1]|jgi:hypothetical protein|nr:MAG: hypothetical protein CVU77_01170 [Elusimicrobia bacterium HGW-Elusimicrobia-1]